MKSQSTPKVLNALTSESRVTFSILSLLIFFVTLLLLQYYKHSYMIWHFCMFSLSFLDFSTFFCRFSCEFSLRGILWASWRHPHRRALPWGDQLQGPRPGLRSWMLMLSVVNCGFQSYGDMGMDQYLLIPIFRGMNIHLPAILMFTRGIGFWPIPICK